MKFSLLKMKIITDDKYFIIASILGVATFLLLYSHIKHPIDFAILGIIIFVIAFKDVYNFYTNKTMKSRLYILEYNPGNSNKRKIAMLFCLLLSTLALTLIAIDLLGLNINIG